MENWFKFLKNISNCLIVIKNKENIGEDLLIIKGKDFVSVWYR